MLTAVVCSWERCAPIATNEADAVLIEERPLVPLTGRRRGGACPSPDRRLEQRAEATDDLLTMTTGDGERFRAVAGLALGEGLVRLPDQEGLAAFATSCDGNDARPCCTASGRRPGILEPSGG